MDQNGSEGFVFEPDFMSMQSVFPDEYLLELLIGQYMSNGFSQEYSQTPFPKSRVIKKSEELSATYLAKGEAALATNQFNKAIVAFSHHLVLAPKFSTKIADCYIGRSIALQKLKAFVESLEDVERALKLSISKEQRKQLLDRKTVLESLNATLNFERLNLKNSSKEKITLSYGENEEMKGVSSAITLNYNKKFGRHYVATRDIKVGDVLMIQKPFVFVPEPGGTFSRENLWTCDYCLSMILAPIPCDNCTFSVYCSIECRSDAYKKYHKIECKIAQCDPPIGSETSLFLRSVLVATEQGEKFQDAVTIMEEIKNAKDKRNVGFKDGIFDGCSPAAVLSLLPHSDKKVSAIVINAAYTSTALKKHTDFLKGKNQNDILKLGQFFTYLSYICHMNLYNIRRNSFTSRIAFAMYPAFNLLNHSCACNTLSYDDEDRNKILRACKNIKKGDQIYVSYNSFDVMNMTTEERRKFFNENKYFNCECECCEKNYTYKSELRGKLKVPKFLQKKLRTKPNDTESLWALLKLLLDDYKYPCLEAKIIEFALVNAHLGAKNEEFCQLFEDLRILK